MDTISPGSWLCELGSEDPMLFETNCFDNDFNAEDMAFMVKAFMGSEDPMLFETNCFDNDFNAEDMAFMVKAFETNSFSSSSHHNALAPPLPNTNTSTLSPQHDYASLNAIMQDANRPTPTVFGFGPSNHPQREDASSSSDMDLGMMHHQEAVASPTRKRRGGSKAPRDHIMAERKRREKISESFIALSALVPGLKKTDKTSVLGEAIKHMKQMQERLKTLEEDAAKRTVESVIVRRSHVMADDDDNDDVTEDREFSSQPLPEMEAKFSGKNVLLKICLANRKGGIVKILSEIEKLHLSVVNVHATTFGHTTLDLTVLAQMDKDFDMIPKHLVRGLRSALEQ